MKPLRILCGFLCVLCVELQTSAGVVLNAPGHVVVEGETTMVRGGEPGAAFTMVDWHGRAVEGASGVFGDDGTAAIPPLPTGYYRMVDDGKRTTATLAVVSPPRPFQDGEAADFKPQRGDSKADGRINGGFLAADTGLIWPTARGEAFLCPWNGGDAQRTLVDLIWLCGIRHVRDRLSPGAVMQKPDSFGGSYFLRNAELFAERGIGVCDTYSDAPAWTALRKKMPTDLAALRGMCERLAKEFGGRMEAWEFWNEPDEDLSVVVRVELDEDDWAITRNKTRAVPRRGDGGRLRVVVWNLGDTAKTGTVEVAGGHLAGLPARPFALGPRGTPPVAFDCAFQPLDDGVLIPILSCTVFSTGSAAAGLACQYGWKRGFSPDARKRRSRGAT